MTQFILDFKHRDDDGPLHVGTFPDRNAALTHLEWLGLWESVWSIHRLTPPEDDYPRAAS